MVKASARKRIGTQAENELLKLFWARGFAALRSAGSGAMRYPGPDLLVGNSKRVLAIECKKTKETKKYLPKEEIEGLRFFARSFGAEPYLGLKFPDHPWLLVALDDLNETEKSRYISKEQAIIKGLGVEEI